MPAGVGKSALLKICALLEKDDIAIVTPTLGARRADQEVVDSYTALRGSAAVTRELRPRKRVRKWSDYNCSPGRRRG